jgi:hypothetical protein
MNRRQFLLASACAAVAGCGPGPVPFGGSPQAPQNDADRIQDDLAWKASYPRVRNRDWVAPDAERRVPALATDFVSAVPELADFARKAVLLHPRYSDEPSVDGSKLGGVFLWSATEDWPVCPNHPTLRLAPVLQLRADDFPEVEFRAGTDLLQLLWCPREHERCWARPVVFWRKRDAVDESLAVMPADATAYPRYIPHPCRLFSERVTDLPQWDASGGAQADPLGLLLGKLDEWNSQTGKFPGQKMQNVYHESFPYGGWKLGGHATWVQGPEVPVCRAGHTMKLLLTCAGEFQTVPQAPVQERRLYADPARRDLAAVENAVNAPRLRFPGDGIQFTFICRQCQDWPIETISQS